MDIPTYLIVLYGIILVFITIVIILYIIRPRPSLKDYAPTQISLSAESPTVVVQSSDVNQTLEVTPGSSLMTFVNVQLADKTPRMANVYQPLFSVAGSWSFELSPTPATQADTTARLAVMTSSPNGIIPEYIELPNLPLQKWMFIAILRDGRRFDIIYDNKLVASHRLQYYPAVVSNPLTMGGGPYTGSAIHMLLSSQRLAPSFVEAQRAGLSNTNGAPEQAWWKTLLWPSSISLQAQSIPDLLQAPVTTPPANHLKAWSTPYA